VIATTYALARGIRLRREEDGSALLLVPEGIVTLNAPAAAALEMLGNGARDFDAIVAGLAADFDDPEGSLATDVRVLLDDLAERGYLTR